MPRHRPMVTLIHNDAAGDGSHRRDDIVATIAGAGFAVAAFSPKRGDLAAVLAAPAALIVAAGGDGTVRRVMLAARPQGPPVTVLPLGTANNIARSLGITAPLPQLAAGWRQARARALHLIRAEGPWGCRRLVEGIGFGALAQAISLLTPTDATPSEARRRIAEIVLAAPPEHLDMRGDGAGGESAFALCEVTSFRLVGPNLLLAPDADPFDRRLEWCLLGAADADRRRFAGWLRQPAGEAPAPLTVRSVASLSVAGRVAGVRLDDEAWVNETGLAVTMTLTADPEPLFFLVP